VIIITISTPDTVNVGVTPPDHFGTGDHVIAGPDGPALVKMNVAAELFPDCAPVIVQVPYPGVAVITLPDAKLIVCGPVTLPNTFIIS
jgi:hypothetical protein